MDLRGAVDLSSLATRAQRPTAPGTTASGPAAGQRPPSDPAAGGAAPQAPEGEGPRVVVDVTDAEFGALVQLSAQVPVVVDLWATWCGPCKQLSPVLERLAEEYAGAFLLAKVDVDANQQIAAAFQVQSVPTVVAVLGGQPVPLFQGAYPEPQVRQVLDEMLKVAAQNGITGRVPSPDAAGAPAEGEPEQPPLPPLHAEARTGLARVGVLRRTLGADPSAARAAADAPGADVETVLLAADLDLLDGDVDSAFARLVALVRVSHGDDRDRARTHLVDLFEVVGSDDERVAPARRALAAALY